MGSKKAPYSVAAEKAVLGSILVEPKLMDQVRPIIGTGGDFFKSQHGQIFDAMIAADQPLSRKHLIERLDDKGLLEQIGGEPYLDELQAVGVNAQAVIAQAQQVREKARVRCLIDAASEILSEAYRGEAPFDEVMARARQRLNQVEQGARD